MRNPKSKYCKTCDTIKLKTEFNKDKQRKDGLQGKCAVCKRAEKNEYNAKNKAKKKQYQLNFLKSHPGYTKKYREANKERIRELQKNWEQKNKKNKKKSKNEQ